MIVKMNKVKNYIKLITFFLILHSCGIKAQINCTVMFDSLSEERIKYYEFFFNNNLSRSSVPREFLVVPIKHQEDHYCIAGSWIIESFIKEDPTVNIKNLDKIILAGLNGVPIDLSHVPISQIKGVALHEEKILKLDSLETSVLIEEFVEKNAKFQKYMNDNKVIISYPREPMNHNDLAQFIYVLAKRGFYLENSPYNFSIVDSFKEGRLKGLKNYNE